MTQLTILGIPSSYGDLLTTTNNGNGLTTTLENLQDGLGNNSPVQIATNAINFNRTGGRSFQLDGIPLTVSATVLNNLGGGTLITGTLSPAQVMSMHGASIEVIPAPGANTIVLVNRFILSIVYNSVQYINGGDVYLQYTANGVIAGPHFSSDVIVGSLVRNNASATGAAIGGIEGGGGFLPNPQITNTPICITNQGAAFANGDSNVNYYIYYTIFNL